jgi:hypothetical protein
MNTATAIVFPLCALIATPSVFAGDTEPPNIIFIVLDDIGIDASTFEPFGWNAAPAAPEWPVLQAIANDGVSFTNFWATPECSPSRACFLTGRWGHRTGVTTAIVNPMLASTNLKPSEVTLPDLLSTAGYDVAMIGKYHLAGEPPSTPPGFGYEAPAATVRLDRYEGYWALPPSIDETVGGQGDGTTAPCGFPTAGIGELGAACFPSGSCSDGTMIWGDCEENISPLEALARGGLPLLNSDGTLATSCDDCAAIDVCDGASYNDAYLNAYYAWQQLHTNASGDYTENYPVVEPTREYMTSWISRRSAEWIAVQEAQDDGPWMCMVTHSSAHTPIQTPPFELTGVNATPLNCTLPTIDPNIQYREVYSLMVESLDRSIGNMLVALGYGTWGQDGFELEDLASKNVMLVVLADNGSYAYTVFPPFSPTQSKQTVYQTGVWVPCVVAGAGVNAAPGSQTTVDHDVNVVDLFGLFCDVAGVDYASEVEAHAPGRVLDAKSMLPYLTDPTHDAIRDFDFAVYQSGMYPATPGSEHYEEGGVAGACINGLLLIDQLISSPCFCEDNGGLWLPAASCGDVPEVYSYCDLYEAYLEDPCSDLLVDRLGNRYTFTFPVPDDCPTVDCGGKSVTPTCVNPPTRGQWAVRSGRWKLIVQLFPSCLPEEDQCMIEFFLLGNVTPPHSPGIESSAATQTLDIDNLNPVAQAKFDALKSYMYETLASESFCMGDGNQDLKVDGADLAGVLGDWGYSSFWDINRNGIADGADIGLILANWTSDCSGQSVPKGLTLPFNDPAAIPACIQP